MILTAETTLHGIVSALDARKSGTTWMARCPAHDDRTPSLSITIRNGKLLVCCHAGCPQTSVISALRARDLWVADSSYASVPDPFGTLETTYDYVDERGVLLYQVCRFMPKTFRPRRPSPGGWTPGYGDARRVLYRLPEVLEAPIVIVVEGEKDVESLRERGFVATTNSGGSKAPWLPAYTEALRGREVIVIPDNDRPGVARALQVSDELLGSVSRLSILKLDNAKDIYEWFDKGHSELEFINRLEAEHEN